MRVLSLFLVVGIICSADSACSAKRAPAAAPVAIIPPPSGPTPSERLDKANALLRDGCLDCLLEANEQFEALANIPPVAAAAVAGIVKSDALVAIRERSLGMSDSGHLERARNLVAPNDDLRFTFGVALDAIEATSPRIGRVVSEQADADVVRRARTIQQNGPGWLTILSTAADEDPFWAAVWVSFSCANSPTATGRRAPALLAPLHTHKDDPLVRWEVSTCGNLDGAAVQKLVDDEPRFHEADYWLAFGELARTDLDKAQVMLTRAYQWHPDWPSAAQTLGTLFVTSEDFGPALDMYNRALTLLPRLGDAMIGRVLALSYLGQHPEAIEGANAFLQGLPGDAHFWLAWNENQLGQIEVAWTDAEEARRLRNNGEVAKLGGIIAYRRHELDTARSRFEEARRLAADDCDATFFLGAVQAELKGWAPSAEAYVAACACFDSAIEAFNAQIAKIEQSDAGPERKTLKIEQRKAKIAIAERERRQSWFNLGADYFNLQKFTEARQYAEKVRDDEQFGERARALLDELKNP